MENKHIKTYNDTYLYGHYPQYTVMLTDAIMKADRIDKDDKMFDDVVYEIKRARTSQSILQVLTSSNTVLIQPAHVLPKPFKVFVAKDIQNNKNTKAFIDVSTCITRGVDGYKTQDITLISHLVNAKFAMYYTFGKVNLSARSTLASQCFALLYSHIVDYVGKISALEYAKEKCLYLSARYFAQCVIGLDEDQARSIARKISGITEMKENTYDVMVERYSKDSDPFVNIKNFTAFIAKEFKIEKFNLDILVERWMYLYGQGTVFALEYYPALSAMLTDAYCGAYINNQKTIEKICSKYMIEYAKNIIYTL